MAFLLLMALAMLAGLSTGDDTFGKQCVLGTALSETAQADCHVATEVRHVGAVLLSFMLFTALFAFWRSAATED